MPLTTNKGDGLDEDEYCEQLFKDKHYRTPEGRYVVPLIWKKNPPKLGGSYYKALGFFLNQEKKLERDEEHRKMFDDFMREYIDLNHMEVLERKDNCDNSGNVYYIPYFSVIKKDALTT
jgi:hypothetical protein